MNHTLKSLLAAVVGAGMWLMWNVEHEHTSIRAPWTGLTLAASAAGFMAAGLVGRGWRALVCAAAVAAAAPVLVDALFWHDEAVEAASDPMCDPGCISREALMVLAAIVASASAGFGIGVRRVVRAVPTGRATAAA